ncbi:hypothetical protein N2152v2_004704 [Parachlorella kessleri]
MSTTPDELAGAAEVIPGLLYFQCLQQPFAAVASPIAASNTCYYLDNDLIYEPFCADFGPCNLAHTYRFCMRLNALLQQATSTGQRVYLLVGSHPHKRANAAALIGIYSALFLGRTPEEAYAPLQRLEPFAGFRDASCGVPTYQLGVLDAIRGMWKAKEVGFIQWHKGAPFDVDEYEHYEQVENGDLNWIVPGKLLAFSGPSAQPRHFGGWRTYMPEDYIEYFREKGVTAVVRLNKKMYEAGRFTQYGVKHYEMYFPDGTCPSEPIMYRFLDVVEKEPGALAVHCKAGLGRTGVLICCYMIKYYGFTAQEAMGYIRVCRPGSVIGPQQHYLLHYAPRLLQEGMHLRKAPLPASLHEQQQRPGSAPAAGRLSAQQAPQQHPQQQAQRKVVEIFADCRAGGPSPASSAGSALTATAAHYAQPLRRSPRHSGKSSTEAGIPASAQEQAVQPPPLQLPTATAQQMSRLEITEDRDYMVSVPSQQMPPAHPNKPGHARGAPIHIHVSVERPAPQPSPRTQLAAMASAGARQPTVAVAAAAGTPTRPGSSGSAAASANVTPTANIASRAGRSSTKRILAPNGQPRKIPMAMNLDDVASAVVDADSEDSWTVSSRPSDSKYNGSSRVSAFAAAAGRGATAFVEAFRHAVGSYRTEHRSGRRSSSGGS